MNRLARAIVLVATALLGADQAASIASTRGHGGRESIVGCRGLAALGEAATDRYAALLRGGAGPRHPAGSEGPAPSHPQGARAREQSVENEVLENVRTLAIGDHILADLALSDAFMRRIADRVIRESYQQHFHVVVRDPGAPDPDPDPSFTPETAPRTGEGSIRVLRATLPAPVAAARRGYPETRPSRRGFRAPVLADRDDPRPLDASGATAAQRATADLVATRLARDGLLPTVVRAIECLGPEERGRNPFEILARLDAAGVPTDLLRHFGIVEDPRSQPCAIVAYVVRRFDDGARSAAIVRELTEVPFRFGASGADFRVATESGEDDIGTVRLQLTRGSYWQAIGAGGSVDVARQLVAELSEADFIVSIEERFLEPFLDIATGWPLDRPDQMTILAEPLPVAQWAQDNGKPGLVTGADGATRIATLVPRYASRREDGSVFVPGESFLVDGLVAAGHAVVHSPLLFQGGNMLAVRDPRTGERILLIGEAEIYRNTALGLTHGQVLEAFGVEFGVDRCLVLPSIAFHVDYDLTVRGTRDGLIAFVNDAPAAARIILDLGGRALARHGVLDADEAARARQALATGDGDGYLRIVAPRVYGLSDGRGHYPLSLAEAFTASDADSPVGNLQRFLAALDVLVAVTVQPGPAPQGRNLQAYLRALRRAEDARRALRETLEQEGWTVVAVPGLVEADRSVVYVNGVHDPGRYLMPAYGGHLEPLDRAAAEVFRTALGPGVRVVPILSGETQRRCGAVHCSIAVYPATGSP